MENPLLFEYRILYCPSKNDKFYDRMENQVLRLRVTLSVLRKINAKH